MDGDYEYPVAGWAAVPSSEDEPLELLIHRWDKDREAGEMFIEGTGVHHASVTEIHERWQGLMEDIRCRSSSTEADSWEALWDEEDAESCPSLDERVQARSASATVTRSEEELWAACMLGGEDEDEGKRPPMVPNRALLSIPHPTSPHFLPLPSVNRSTTSQTSTAKHSKHLSQHSHTNIDRSTDQPLLSPYPRPCYLRLSSLTGPPSLPHSDVMGPYRNSLASSSNLSSASSLSKSLDLSTSPSGVEAQGDDAPGGRRMTIQMHEEPSIVHSFAYHAPTHSYCESAILKPNSPPQRERHPSLSGFSEAEEGRMRPSRFAASVNPRPSSNTGYLDQRHFNVTSPALKPCNSLLGEGHPHNSDVSLLDLGLGAVTDSVGTLGVGASDASNLSTTDKRDQDTLTSPSISVANRRTLARGMRVPILRTDSTGLSSDSDAIEVSAVSPSCGDSVAVFHLDEDLAKLDALKVCSSLTAAT